MEITIRKETIVRPTHNTPTHTLWNSNMDLAALGKHFSSVYLYKPNGSSNYFDANVLKEALGKALVHFYPLTGRLKLDKNGRVEIDCNAEGVLFIEAETIATFDDLGEFVPDWKFNPLVPAVDYSGGISLYSLALVQGTYFSCGGVSLSFSPHHTLIDGPSALHFVNTWSDMARGLALTIPPVMDRTLLRARDPPHHVFEHIEFKPSPTLNKTYRIDQVPETLTTSTFKITQKLINILKSKSTDNGNATINYSAFVVLVDHVWRCACRACKLPDDQNSKLVIIVDGRRRLQPMLPPGYFGNSMFKAALISNAGDIISKPLATVSKIREALVRMDNDYLKSAIDYLEVIPDVSSLYTFQSPSVAVIDWSRLPVHDADGWGRPSYMGPTVVPFPGMAYILPSQYDDGNLYLAIRLPLNQMQLFANYIYDI